MALVAAATQAVVHLGPRPKTREPSLPEPAAISVPAESPPESFACRSALPDAHADDESPDWPDSCRICVAENALLLLLLSWPGAQKLPPLRTLCASSTPLPCCLGDGGDGDGALWMG